MARAERQKLLGDLEKEREGNLVISYVTSTRGNFEIQMADDVLPLLYQHLERNATRAKKEVDLFIHSNGGSGTVPWRIVNLVREFAGKFVVLVPFLPRIPITEQKQKGIDDCKEATKRKSCPPATRK
jgi:hypothetical protein